MRRHEYISDATSQNMHNPVWRTWIKRTIIRNKLKLDVALVYATFTAWHFSVLKSFMQVDLTIYPNSSTRTQPCRQPCNLHEAIALANDPGFRINSYGL